MAAIRLRAWRAVFLGIGLLAVGLWWGGLRLAMLDHSILRTHIGESGAAVVAVTGPARRSRYALRVEAEVRRFADEPIDETVLLELPRERAPPEGAVIELRARQEVVEAGRLEDVLKPGVKFGLVPEHDAFEQRTTLPRRPASQR